MDTFILLIEKNTMFNPIDYIDILGNIAPLGLKGVGMAIIKSKNSIAKEKIKAVISSDVAKKIGEYCQWANIDDLGFFIEESASFIFSKDKDWKDYQRSVQREKNKE